MFSTQVAAAGRLRGSAETAAACDAALRAAGRASYVLAVGPVTPAKLANFAEVEAFALVGADAAEIEALQRELPAPIVSAAEVAVVLEKRDWLPDDAPFYSTDLDDVALDGAATVTAGADGPAFALAPPPPRRVELAYDDDDAGGGEVVEWRSAAADFLGARDWKGLEVRRGETPVHAARPGRDGVASGYAPVADDADDAPDPPTPPRDLV